MTPQIRFATAESKSLIDINRWSQSFKLKLNAQKSEVIWLGTRQQLAKLSQADMTL